jgi:hypothetical protein
MKNQIERYCFHPLLPEDIFRQTKLKASLSLINLQEQIGAHQHLSLQNSKQVAPSYQSKIKEKHKNKSFEGVTHKMRH